MKAAKLVMSREQQTTAPVEIIDRPPAKRYQGVRPPIPIGKIVSSVCAVCEVEPGELGSPTRHPAVVAARSLVVHIARERTRLSYPELADVLGRPNHSTVITAHVRIKGLLAMDKADSRRQVPTCGDIGELLELAEFAIDPQLAVQKGQHAPEIKPVEQEVGQ